MNETNEDRTTNDKVKYLVDMRVNERFAQIKAELNEQLASWRQSESASQVDGEPLYRIQSYISMLVQVHSIGHKVDKELEEALLKLKELTFA